ncbi:hypothetical protein ACIBI4_14445 [Streptomyces sp. NPDC050418]|uniref:hypothetical protein n=1 Tax=Streptomyces sp. NPDC050418 TaxID=3365612 RepID=UPI00378D4234
MDSRDFVQLVGRRAALRYVLAGVAAATMAACSGEGSTSVKSQTLGAFLKGSWKFEAEDSAGVRIDVAEGGSWMVTGGEADAPWTTEGTWSLDGGRLTVELTEEERAPYVVQEVPDKVEKTLKGSYALSGGLIDDGGQEEGLSKLEISGSKDKMVLTFAGNDGGEEQVATCTRVESPEAP